MPKFQFAHVVHAGYTPTLVFFNNCRLTNVSLVQFENKRFKLVARCLNQCKNMKVLRNNHLVTLPVAAFLC